MKSVTIIEIQFKNTIALEARVESSSAFQTRSKNSSIFQARPCLNFAYSDIFRYIEKNTHNKKQ